MTIPRCCLLLYVLALSLVSSAAASAAPAPSPRRCDRRPLCEVLPGRWVMRWGGAPYDLTLERGGGYRCTLGTLEWVGSWAADGHGRFRITESTRPLDASSWRSYCVRFGPGMLAGREENSGVEVRLERK